MFGSLRHFHFGLRLAGFSLIGILGCAGVCAWVAHTHQAEALVAQSEEYLLSLARSAALLASKDPDSSLHRAAGGGAEDSTETGSRSRHSAWDELLASSTLDGLRPSLFYFRVVAGPGKDLELEMVRSAEGDAARTHYAGKHLATADHHTKALLGIPSVTGCYVDFDGQWISAVVPVRDDQGHITGLVQADLPATRIEDATMGVVLEVLKVGFLCALAAMGLALLWGWRYEQCVRSMGRALLQIAESDFRRQILPEQPDELAGLSAVLNRMLELLRMSQAKLQIQCFKTKETLKKVEKTLQTRNRFLASLSQELRSTMNGVLGVNQILLGTPMTPEQRDLLLTIQQNSNSLLTLLNDVLDYSKIEAGQLTFVHIDFDLRRLLESIVDQQAEAACRKGLEFVASIEEDLPSAVRGDPGRLRQVLANLLGNAVKFTAKGEVTLSVRAERAQPGETTLYVNVRDTGVGVTEELLLGMFQWFDEHENHLGSRFEGTGLGLAICKNLVEAMQGNIGVESRVGEGSNFWFTVKLSLAEETPPLRPLLADEFYGKRVLIVDDHAAFCEATGRLLSAWGIRSDQATDGVDALRFLHRDANLNIPYEMVLVDARLEGMDGFTLARAILRDEQLTGTKVVLLTTGKDQFDQSAFPSAGIWRCLRKPLKRLELLECLRAAFSPSPAPEAHSAPSPTPLLSAQDGLSVRPRCEGLRLLLAEDNRVGQKLGAFFGRKLGCEIAVVGDGLSALAAWRKEAFDFVLLDCFLPELDGFDVARQIRKEEAQARQANPNLPPTYIIAISPNTMANDCETSFDAGMNDCLFHPITLEALEAALVRGLKRRRELTQVA